MPSSAADESSSVSSSSAEDSSSDVTSSAGASSTTDADSEGDSSVPPISIWSNSSRSMTPFPSASISATNRSTWEGGRSARLRLNKPALSSSESIVPSEFSSNLSNSFRMLMPVSAIHWRKMSMTLSATNRTPHSGHCVESNGTRA